MTESVANFAASCFATLAYLLCFSAAPVAGQDTSNATPDASPTPPVLSPVPNVILTPRPVVSVVSTAPPATVSATPPAINPVLLVVLPVVLTGILTFASTTISAWFVTRKIERERLEFQAETERQRMEFQKEAELQKQRMELYKMLFTERIAFAKKAASLVNDVHKTAVTINKKCSMEAECEIAALGVARVELIAFTNVHIWLVNSEVNQGLSEICGLAKQVLGEDKEVQFKELEEREAAVTALKYACDKVDAAVKKMMLNNDLAEIVNPK